MELKVKIPFYLLSILILFNGVNLNQGFSLPSGTIGVIQTTLTFLILYYNIKSKSNNFLILSLLFMLFLFSLAIIGFLTTSSFDISSLSQVSSYGLFTILIASNATCIRKSMLDHIMVFMIIANIIAFILYVIAIQFNVDLHFFPEPWLYDKLFRFSGTFGEPSYMGFFSLIALIYFISDKKLVLSTVCLVFLLASRSKLTLIILPLLIFLFLIKFPTKEYLGKKKLALLYTISIPTTFIVFLNANFIFGYLIEYVNYYDTKTFATRFFFPITSLEYIIHYPLGSGLFGFRDTLKPFIYDFNFLYPKIDTSELQGYLTGAEYDSFSPKDAFSFFLLSIGIIGIFLYFYLWKYIFFNICNSSRTRTIAFSVYILSFFSIQINLIWLFSLLIIYILSRNESNDYCS